MKKILITGADSYIGTSFEKWVMDPKFEGRYQVDTVDMRGDGWREKDFSGYDVVFHVAGIAHVKETEKNKSLYYHINRELAIDTAKKAKQEGAKQFIFLSSMSIYGVEAGRITEKTIPIPKTHYGMSKWMAENALKELESDLFKIVILRPPMIYGKYCRGNYPLLSSFAQKVPFFPYTTNQRSMLYIDNLSDFVRRLIDDNRRGIFFPQNREYVNVCQLVKKIATLKRHRIILIRGVGPILLFLGGKRVKKVLGTLIYDIKRDRCDIFSFEESIRRTET